MHLLKDIPLKATTSLVQSHFPPLSWIIFYYLIKMQETKQKLLLIPNPTLATTPFLYFSFFLELPSISVLLPLDPKTDLAKDVMVEIGQMVTKLFPLPGHTNK